MKSFEEFKSEVYQEDLKQGGEWINVIKHKAIFNHDDPKTFLDAYRKFWDLSMWDLSHEYETYVN